MPTKKKNMVWGLEEEVARRLAEEEEKLAGAEEEMKSLQIQVDVGLQKKKDEAEEERKEVQKEWAVHHPFSLFGPRPRTWKEMAEWMGEEKKGMKAEKERVEKIRHLTKSP